MPDQPTVTLDRANLDAVLFDLDGVVTRTARVHAAAWKRLFDAYLHERPAAPGEDHAPFDIERDYRRLVDGKPRIDGVRDFLAARGIELPAGAPDDPPGRETLHGLGNRKNRLFRDALREGGLTVYDCAVALLRRLREADFRTAVVTASKNCGMILDTAGIADLFDARVDGNDAERLGLAGKPAPDTFLAAAARLACEPGRAAVLEDAVAGVRAGHAGGFGLVIGVDRGGERAALSAAGANVVLADLCDLTVTADTDTDADTDADTDTGPPLLEDPAAIAERLANRLADRCPALFLDYDGTLTPIVARPEDARLDASMRAALRAAAAVMPVAIISGRDLDDVRALVGLDNLVYAGSHGFDIRGPELRLELPEGVDALEDLDRAADLLEQRLDAIPGSQVERKRFAVAVHYRRLAVADLPRVEQAVAEVARRLPALRRTGGKKVFELRPDIDWDKGRALHWLLERLDLDGPDVLPLYIGDDETDEDAFRALADGGGVGILVAAEPRPSSAAFRIPNTDAVRAVLEDLARREGTDDERGRS